MDNTNIGAMILIIDDDITSSTVLQHLLSREGFRTLVASNGLDGRQIASSEMPDIILLDMIMPGENGLETCQHLQEASATSGIPVIFISSVQEIGSKVAGFDAGAVDYITKPFDRSEVLARVRVHLRQSRSRQMLIESHIEKLKQLTEAQKSLGPSPEELPDAGYAVYYNSLYEAGGDFYDVVRVAEHVYDYVVADFSGHNLGSSIATGALKAILLQSQSLLYSPREAVLMISDVISSVLQEDQFVTLVYARLNRAMNTLYVVNAGHPPCVVVKQSGGHMTLGRHGDVLGIHDRPRIEAQELQLSSGDRIFLYTDGYLDGYGFMRSPELAFDSLVRACCETIDIPLSEAMDRVAGLAFPDSTLINDDLLMLAVEV